MIRGILFDKDGTLFDFNATWRAVAEAGVALFAAGDADLSRALARAAGYDPDARCFAPGSPLVAGSAADVAAAWAPLLPHASRRELERAVNRFAEDEGVQLAPAAADLPALLHRLGAEAGRALGVATHDSEAAARKHLHEVGALDRFAFIAGYDSGHGLKPGPGMVHAFCEAADLAPEHVAMIGDSVHDLKAGRAAGAGLVAAVLTGPAEAETLAPFADIVMPSIESLPDVLERMAR